MKHTQEQKLVEIIDKKEKKKMVCCLTGETDVQYIMRCFKIYE